MAKLAGVAGEATVEPCASTEWDGVREKPYSIDNARSPCASLGVWLHFRKQDGIRNCLFRCAFSEGIEMTKRLKVLYEDGVLKPLESLRGLSEHQVLDITLEMDAGRHETDEGQRRIVQLGGVLKAHELEDVQLDLTDMRARSWAHVTSEIVDE